MKAQRRFVAYAQVHYQWSAGKLEQQLAEIRRTVAELGGTVVGEFREIGDRRPLARKAVALARAEKATLIVTEPYRLGMRQKAVAAMLTGVKCVAVHYGTPLVPVAVVRGGDGGGGQTRPHHPHHGRPASSGGRGGSAGSASHPTASHPPPTH